MPEWTILAVSAAAIVLILYGLVLALRYRASMPGGVVGRHWRTLVLLVCLFTVGYVLLPFAGLLSEAWLRTIIALVFLFGALYVIITVRLIRQIVLELTE